MESFELKAPIRDQLKAILADYPGGQLISEALQNAEDSGARSFELTLDLRGHDVDETRLAGPAFVLSDDGRWVVVRAPRTNLHHLTLALAHSNTVTDTVSLLFLSIVISTRTKTCRSLDTSNIESTCRHLSSDCIILDPVPY